MAAMLVSSLGVALIVAGLLNASSEPGAITINRTTVAIAHYEDMHAPDGHSIVYVR